MGFGDDVYGGIAFIFTWILSARILSAHVNEGTVKFLYDLKLELILEISELANLDILMMASLHGTALNIGPHFRDRGKVTLMQLYFWSHILIFIIFIAEWITCFDNMRGILCHWPAVQCSKKSRVKQIFQKPLN